MPPEKPSSELSWRSSGVVVASFVGLCLSFAPMYVATLPVFMKEIGHEFGWSRTAVTAGVSVGLVCGMFGPVVGALIDRFRPRNVILISTATFGATLLAMGLLPRNYAVFLALSFILGLAGGAGAGPLGYLSLLPRWFDRRLGLSIGLANMGIGLGMIVMPLVAQWLLRDWGWRGAYFVLSGMVLCIALPTTALLVWNGAQITMPPKQEMGRNSAPALFALSAKSALGTRLFWLLGLSAFLVMSAVAACGVHLFPMLTDRGYSGQTAARIASVLGVSILLSRLLTGILLDYVAPWILGVLFYLGVAAGAALLPLGAGTWGLIGAVVMLGMGQGFEGDLLPYMIRRNFGLKSFGAIYGVMGIAYAFGSLVGPLIAAQAFDRLGTYTPAFSGLALAALVAAIVMAVGVRAAAARLDRERQSRLALILAAPLPSS